MASCTASSAEEKSRKRRATAPSTCGASSRNRCSEVESHDFVIAAFLTASPVADRSSPGALQSACSRALHLDPAPRTLLPRWRKRALASRHRQSSILPEIPCSQEILRL